MITGIYKIENLINHKVYIGKSNNIKRRWAEHKSDYKNSKKNHTHLYKAMNKYGLENFSFSILEECPADNQFLLEREQYWIAYYNSFKEGYNETIGGEGLSQYNPLEIQQLWSQGLCSKEIQNQLGCGNKVVHQALEGYEDYTIELSRLRSNNSERRRKLLSDAALKRWGSGYVYQYDLDGNFLNQYNSSTEAAKSLGKTKDHSIYKALKYDSRSNMAYGYLWSKEKFEKISPYMPSNSICVKNIETGQIFNSYRQASQWAGCVHTTIKNACDKGTSAGYHPETKQPLHWETII